MQIGGFKDQEPVTKANRQLDHYFDYDGWNEKMNSRPPKKSKPNPKKKRNKIFKL